MVSPGQTTKGKPGNEGEVSQTDGSCKSQSTARTAVMAQLNGKSKTQKSKRKMLRQATKGA